MGEDDWSAATAAARENGFDANRLVRTPQTGGSPELTIHGDGMWRFLDWPISRFFDLAIFSRF